MPVLATLLEKINPVIFSPSRTQAHATEMCADAKESGMTGKRALT